MFFVDEVDAQSGKQCGKEIFPVEGLVQAKARGECPHHGNEGVEDGHPAYRIAAEQFVVEGEAEGGNADE